MNHELNPNAKYTEAIYSLWLTWTLPIVSAIAVIVLGLWISPGWLPLVAIGLGILFASYSRSNMRCTMRCSLTPYLMSRVLIVSGMVMIAVMFELKYWGLPRWMGEVNPRAPYIPVMILSLCGVLFAGYAVLRGRKFSHCTACLIGRGLPAEQGFVGRYIGQEGIFQVQFLFRLWALIAILSWVYYFAAYINVNLNSPDRLMFVWVPTILLGLSVGYVGVRYSSLIMYYSYGSRGSKVDFGLTTTLRYLILDDQERIYLAHESGDAVDASEVSRFDTPAIFSFQKREKLPVNEAERMLRDFLPEDADVEVRFMYENYNATQEGNTFHFIATVHNPESLNESGLQGRWMTLPELDRYLATGRVAPMLSAELYRLYTITMAWKSYDRNGRRLYKIKHYRPVFRLKGIQNWDVDFNDLQWLKVAHNNEDRRFFRLRKWWMRFAHGHQE